MIHSMTITPPTTSKPPRLPQFRDDFTGLEKRISQMGEDKPDLLFMLQGSLKGARSLFFGDQGNSTLPQRLYNKDRGIIAMKKTTMKFTTNM